MNPIELFLEFTRLTLESKIIKEKSISL